MTEAAPFHADVAAAPPGARPMWLRTADGVRIRVVAWPDAAGAAARGTVVLFTGRTEYAEKYGRAVADLAARGYATLVIDWRGQGLSDRPDWDRRMGHVEDFADYQHDLRAALSAGQALGLPEPYVALSHSMGGAIALRAVMGDHPFAAAVFSAPMWGISLRPIEAPVARPFAAIAAAVGLGRRYVPGTEARNYLEIAPFEGNALTTDRAMWDMMRQQLATHPDLALGGPSLNWLHAAFRETAALAQMPSPALPCLTVVGGRERVVVVPRIEARMAAWPGGTLLREPDAEHEVMMDRAPIRARFFDAAAALFDRCGTAAA